MERVFLVYHADIIILYCFAAGDNTTFGQRAVYKNETKILQNIIL